MLNRSFNVEMEFYFENRQIIRLTQILTANIDMLGLIRVCDVTAV